jgi:HEAT repeat protein
MLQALTDIVAGLTGLVVLLVLLLIVIRMAAIKRGRRIRRFRPAAEASLGTYLAGSDAAPAMAGQSERALFLAVAQEALGDLRGDERNRLVDLLLQLGFMQDATIGLKARRAATRRRAAETLAALATPQAVLVVAAAMADRDVLVRTTSAGTLAMTGGEDAVPAIAAVAQQDALAAPGAAASVVLALAQRWPEALAPLLGHGAPASIRRIAVTVAADLRLAQLAGQLQACLDTDDVAASAARGLGRIGAFTAVAPLARLAGDNDRSPRARAAAATALGAIGDPSSLAVLERLLMAPDWSLQAAAAGALAHLRGPGSAALRRAVTSGHQEAAALAEAAMDP